MVFRVLAPLVDTAFAARRAVPDFAFLAGFFGVAVRFAATLRELPCRGAAMLFLVTVFLVTVFLCVVADRFPVLVDCVALDLLTFPVCRVLAFVDFSDVRNLLAALRVGMFASFPCYSKRQQQYERSCMMSMTETGSLLERTLRQPCL